jgi:hypothetical protein
LIDIPLFWLPIENLNHVSRIKLIYFSLLVDGFFAFLLRVNTKKWFSFNVTFTTTERK